MIMVTFTKLFVIRIVANKRSLLSSRLLIFSSEGCFLSAIAFRSDGEREKKAISEADAKPETSKSKPANNNGYNGRNRRSLYGYTVKNICQLA